MAKSFLAKFSAKVTSAVIQNFLDQGRATASVDPGATANNFAPGGAAQWRTTWWQKLAPSADSLITGLDASGSGAADFAFTKILINSSDEKKFTLANGNTGSLVSNRILTPNFEDDFEVQAGGVVVVTYDLEDARWRMVSVGSALAAMLINDGGFLFRDAQQGKIVEFTPADLALIGKNDNLGASGLSSLTGNLIMNMLFRSLHIVTDATASGSFLGFGSGTNFQDAWMVRLAPTGILRIRSWSNSGVNPLGENANPFKYIVNNGSGYVVFNHQDPAANVAQKVTTPDSKEFWLAPNEVVIMLRDHTLNAWRLLARTTANDFVAHGTVQTTDATVATVASFVPGNNSRVINIRTTVVGRQASTDDVTKVVIETVAIRTAGGAVSIKNNDPVSTFEDQAAWAVTLDVSGTTIRARVTGEAAKTIEWRGHMEVSEHG